MDKKLKKLMDNQNLYFDKDNNGLIVYIQPYDRELTLSYVYKRLLKLKELEREIKEYFNVDYFAINLSSYCLDGLTETSNTLIFNGSILQCKYTDVSKVVTL